MPAYPTPVIANTAIGQTPPALDPLGRIVRAYDRAIRACESFDHTAAREAIGLLRAALELDSPASRGFDALYAWCEEAVDGRDFVGPARTLRSLREAWWLAARPSPIAPRPDWPVS
ncbi:MAG: hypothetical protein IPP90_05265 [Gemmatimonadaceae bacterium]|nr:hypothetical protein [Gemmatimonadaceae bacterium]